MEEGRILSRHSDPTVIHCADCGWVGTVAECIHTYSKGIGDFEPEPIDECPKCNSTEIAVFEGSLP